MGRKSSEKVLRIGTRGSALALTQSKGVAAEIRRRNPGLKVRLTIIRSFGDKHPRADLRKAPGVGAFVRELERALLAGRIDAAVHSLKDLPTDLPEGLVLAAATRREDVRDCAILRSGRSLSDLPRGARVGTGSPRRARQILARWPHLRIVPIRGNVDTRLRKVADGEIAAVVLALAGLKRLGRRREATCILPLSAVLPAPGQGALAIETRTGDDFAKSVAATLDHRDTHLAVIAERAALKALGGGCHLPLGAHARIVRGKKSRSAASLRMAIDGFLWRRGSGCRRARVAGAVGHGLAAEALGVRLANMLRGRQ